ncbi:hypothetical protein VNO78_07309 [Psophocarpus tetragonolobus]|uniref:Uncharacterized protein n=1 Tax=Psophocarpus tetragonolobus TaxID=3891 RepID=A0AAN9T2X0_PSOTE
MDPFLCCQRFPGPRKKGRQSPKGDHFARFGGHLSQPPVPDCVLTPIQFLGQFPLRTKKEIAYSKKNHSIKLVSIIKREKPAPKVRLTPLDRKKRASRFFEGFKPCFSGEHGFPWHLSSTGTPCLQKVPRGRAIRRKRTTRERIPHRQEDRRRPSRGTSRPTGKTDEWREGLYQPNPWDLLQPHDVMRDLGFRV